MKPKVKNGIVVFRYYALNLIKAIELVLQAFTAVNNHMNNNVKLKIQN